MQRQQLTIEQPDPPVPLLRVCVYPGMKSRGVYETPGGTLLLTARRAMESITLDRGEAHLKVGFFGGGRDRCTARGMRCAHAYQGVDCAHAPGTDPLLNVHPAPPHTITAVCQHVPGDPLPSLQAKMLSCVLLPVRPPPSNTG